MTTATLLLTGFAPFGGETVNPSWLAVKALDGRRIAGHRIVARELPVEFGVSLKRMRALLREHRPAMVIAVGQAGGRPALSLERIAINVDDARIPDNGGRQPVDAPVVADGPAAYFTTLPVKAMRAAITAADIPVEVSQTAGTFVCNHVFYGLMHALRRSRRVRAGFIHVPYSTEQAAGRPGVPALSIDAMVEGLRIAIATALRTPVDVAISAGAEH